MAKQPIERFIDQQMQLTDWAEPAYWTCAVRCDTHFKGSDSNGPIYFIFLFSGILEFKWSQPRGCV